MTQVRYLGFMPAKKYLVTLTQEERQQLQKIAQSNHHSVREKTRARILLLADTHGKDGSLKDAQIAGQLRCTSLSVSTVRQRATERGALPSVKHKEQERRKARAHWTGSKRHILSRLPARPHRREENAGPCNCSKTA